MEIVKIEMQLEKYGVEEFRAHLSVDFRGGSETVQRTAAEIFNIAVPDSSVWTWAEEILYAWRTVHEADRLEPGE